jgi:4-alpha-glucanotransferase
MLIGEDGTTQQLIMMETVNGSDWVYHHKVSKNTQLSYKYILIDQDTIKAKEWGPNRECNFKVNVDTLVEDKWRDRSIIANSFLTSAFTKAIFHRKPCTANHIKAPNRKLSFEFWCSIINENEIFGIVGAGDLLGSWKKPLVLSDATFPVWSINIPCNDVPNYLEYKYVKLDAKTHEILEWETGENRVYRPWQPSKHTIVRDDHFRTEKTWHGVGVAIPVFSLRSTRSFGIGEFLDLEYLIEWTHKTNMNVIQVLPVNDTLATMTWVDSYPYASISVAALHPLYVNIAAMGVFKNAAVVKEYLKDIQTLNKLEVIDFELTLKKKFHYFNILFKDLYTDIIKDKEIQAFVSSQSSWIKAYAAFCVLRDKYGTSQYGEWPTLSKYDKETVDRMMDKGHEDFERVMFYIWIQYHADKQLLSMRNLAREHGIALKGDLPIGIYRYSCDAWIAPELYNMGQQAGAPPDDYAEQGQNWGFPTYNWDIMRQDGYEWWRFRMRQLSRYFDALRIDHILGFFRIWQIPTHHVQGTMGIFNPRLPYDRGELARFGLTGDLTRFVNPWITDSHLGKVFGHKKSEVIKVFLESKEDGNYRFKDQFANQRDISRFIAENASWTDYELSIQNLMSNVILLTEEGGHHFNPRITVHTTQSYQDLAPWQQSYVLKLYNEYYFSRHDIYWQRQALERLPAVMDASNMLICGEDLGMIPATVPVVMKDLNIMSLEIQRMPKGNTRWGMVKEYPYASVCSPSCHDMSTIRGWWESDPEMSKAFYYQYLNQNGISPVECTENIARSIVWDHLVSPSMLAIFPLQDLVAMHDEIKKENAASEQINIPANPKHYWRYRFHINIEELVKYKPLIENIRSMLKHSGRSS